MQFMNSHLGVFIMLISTSNIAGNFHENNNIDSGDRVKRVELNSPVWQVINDDVMGGLSLGSTTLLDTSFMFSGDISIENNGGFSSVYRPVSTLSTQFDSINLRVLGDGNLYQIRIRSQVDGYNLAYKLNFYTKKNVEQHLTFRLSDFQASFRGRLISGAPELKAENVTHVGFLITNKQPISFALIVNDIVFYLSKKNE
jgi:NADH dehydrogenase [ubiquinone] 1 alpha subcomplex assembly factor 1